MGYPGYPEEFWDSIEKVEATRERRLKEVFKELLPRRRKNF